MLKQIILGTAMLASASFATYSYFPVPANHSGEAKLVGGFTMQDKWEGVSMALKGRFVPVEKLEVSLALPFRLMNRDDGKNDSHKTGVQNLSLGARYQVIPNVAAFIDFDFPTGKDAISDDGFKFYFGGQFSQKFGNLDIGTELGLSYTTEGKDKKTPPMELSLAAELDPLLFPNITPYIGIGVNIILNDPKYDGHDGVETSGKTGFFPYVGANFKITEMFSFDLSAKLGFGKDYLSYTCEGNTNTPVTFEASLNFSF
ncbi:MAG: hypothetical protein J6T54_08300 [Fibrobacter sp.]|nr:hypothetical protein [Fibrobacter sp.]